MNSYVVKDEDEVLLANISDQRTIVLPAPRVLDIANRGVEGKVKVVDHEGNVVAELEPHCIVKLVATWTIDQSDVVVGEKKKVKLL